MNKKKIDGWCISLYASILFFILIQLIRLFFNRIPIWDEAVYIGMGKYMMTFGNSGLFEPLRPLLWPFVSGISGGNHLILLLISMICGALLIYLTYEITHRISGTKEAIIAVSLLTITPVFLYWGGFSLTGIPSTLLVLLSIRSILTKKFSTAGFLIGLAFLMRFPQGLAFFATLIYLGCLIFKKEKNILCGLKRYILSFIFTIIPYFAFNLFFYRNITDTILEAVFYPLISASNIISSMYVWMYESHFMFFFKEILFDNPLMIFAIVGIISFIYRSFKTKLNKNLFYIFILLFTYSIYFMTINRMEYRYIIAFLPFIAIFAGIGIVELLKLKIGKPIVLIGILIAVPLIISNLYEAEMFNSDSNEIVVEIYSAFDEKVTILTSDPVITVYVDNPLIIGYYDIESMQKGLDTDPGNILYTESSFPCRFDDEICNIKKSQFEKRLFDSGLLRVKGVYFGKNYGVYYDI